MPRRFFLLHHAHQGAGRVTQNRSQARAICQHLSDAFGPTRDFGNKGRSLQAGLLGRIPGTGTAHAAEASLERSNGGLRRESQPLRPKACSTAARRPLRRGLFDDLATGGGP
ncbi:hypothetical protein Z950_1633 [Sulfitobacter mediterraneus KCTC 32188]|nr:hypothetical protein Z950_1633 [Sulfitobacter mediterraneus KCTC 32188]